jgi:hypothetical protein
MFRFYEKVGGNLANQNCGRGEKNRTGTRSMVVRSKKDPFKAQQWKMCRWTSVSGHLVNDPDSPLLTLKRAVFGTHSHWLVTSRFFSLSRGSAWPDFL